MAAKGPPIAHGWAWSPSAPPATLDEALAVLVKKGFVKAGDVDMETRAELKTLDAPVQMQALIRFQEALLHQKVNSKRYGGGWGGLIARFFLRGIIREMQAQYPRGAPKAAEASDPPAAARGAEAWPIDKPPSTTGEAVQLLIKAGMLHKNDIDDDTRVRLLALPLPEQLYVLQRFHNAVLEHKISSNR